MSARSESTNIIGESRRDAAELARLPLQFDHYKAVVSDTLGRADRAVPAIGPVLTNKLAVTNHLRK